MAVVLFLFCVAGCIALVSVLLRRNPLSDSPSERAHVPLTTPPVDPVLESPSTDLPKSDCPSFRRREDLRRLAIALLSPWLLGAAAWAFPLTGRALVRTGTEAELIGPICLLGFFAFAFPAVLAPVAWFFFGVWRLVRRVEYRRSWYGWAWLLLMYANLAAILPAMHH